MWSLPRRTVGYFLAVVVAAVAAVGASVVRIGFERADVVPTLILTSCAVFHLLTTRRIERARRRSAGGVHIDLNSVWIFAAALVLHPAIAAGLIVLLRTLRWPAARRILHRYVVSTAAAVLSALSVWPVFALSGHSGGLAGLDSQAGGAAVLVASALTYWLVDALLVAGGAALSAPHQTLRGVLGSWHDNLLEFATIGLGITTAVMLSQWPLLVPLLMPPIALVLHRNLLIAPLEQAARIDDKTQLLNDRAWSEQAAHELQRAAQRGEDVGLLMIDIDKFKRINDRYGHLVGDAVLRAVAGALTGQVRRADVVGRFGGEEFSVLLPAVSIWDTAGIAERIRRHVEILRVPVPADGGGELSVSGLTVSVGIALSPSAGSDLEALLDAADNALYAAKEGGRNQVRLAGTPGRLPPLPWDDWDQQTGLPSAGAGPAREPLRPPPPD